MTIPFLFAVLVQLYEENDKPDNALEYPFLSRVPHCRTFRRVFTSVVMPAKDDPPTQVKEVMLRFIEKEIWKKTISSIKFDGTLNGPERHVYASS